MGDDDKNLDLLMNVSKQIANKSTVRRTVSELLMSQKENYKQQMRRFKLERSDRATQIGGHHRFVLDMAARLLNVDAEQLVEGVIDDHRCIEVLNSLFVEGGRCAVCILFQEMGPPDLKSGRYDPNNTNSKMKRGAVTSGSFLEAKDNFVVAYRTKGHINVEMKNVCEEMFFSKTSANPPEKSVVASAWELMDIISDPSLHVLKDWGDLIKSAKGIAIRNGFMGDFEQFINFLYATKQDLEKCLRFTYHEKVYEERLKTPGMVKEASRDVAVYREVMDRVTKWITQMNLALTQSQQLRREDDTFGPMYELEFWRRQLAIFESIIEFVKTPPCRMYIFYILNAKSHLIKKWREVDGNITSCCNEARDNVKYLNTLVKFFDPLYRCDPTTMGMHIPSLINTIRMVFTTSRYFNTTERITPLFFKMTNQMVNVCRAYLTEHGSTTIWKQYKAVVCKKIEVCLNLYTRYFNSYRNTCEEMRQSQLEQPFDCSEMYIFGKFETFKLRIERIVDVIETTILYSILQSSTIEGLEVFANKFADLYKTISYRKYDVLNHRKPDFDVDYEKYKIAAGEIEYYLHEFLVDILEEMPSVQATLMTLARFDKLQLQVFNIEERYMEALEKYLKEIEYIRDIYNELRRDPPIPRNMPPVSGRIIWVRQLYSRLESSMQCFKKKPDVVRNRKGQRCIMMYNSICSVFLHYEQIYHTAWFTYNDQVREFLSQMILFKHPYTNKMLVNFNPYIIETIREGENMWRLGLPVTDCAQVLVFRKARIFNSLELVKQLIAFNNSIRDSIPKLFLNLMRNQIYLMNQAFRPGLSTITWTSLSIPEFCSNTSALLEQIFMFVKSVSDMKEARIDEVIDMLSGFILTTLPEDPVHSSDLLEMNKKFAKETSEEIERRSVAIEASTKELVNKFMSSIPHAAFSKIKFNWLDPERAIKPAGSLTRLVNTQNDEAYKDIEESIITDFRLIHLDAMDLFLFFSSRLSEALIKCTKKTLELIKSRAANRDILGMALPMKPLLKTYLELQIPNFIVKPTLEEMQADFQKCIQCALSVSKGIYSWGQRDPKCPQKIYPVIEWDVDDKDKEEDTSNEYVSFYTAVTEHKDIVRANVALMGAIIRYKSEVQEFVQSFQQYAYLWDTKRNTIIERFVERNPIIVEIKEEFQKFDQWTANVKAIPNVTSIGPIAINTEKAKLGLEIEARAWKAVMGKIFSAQYKQKLLAFVDFIHTQNKILARKLADLDDVRIGMNCLAKIRENFIEMDLDLHLMEEAYAVFAKFEIDVHKEDVDRVDSLRYNFNCMIDKSKEVQLEICRIQAPFGATLIAKVQQLIREVDLFDKDFEENGPMVDGLEAKEASDRVQKFQSKFDDLWDRSEKLANGETLFGMVVHEYPILQNRKKQFNMLSRLYGLYLQVINSIDRYYDTNWSEVDIEAIIAELNDFELRCRKMPKGMKDWPAYLELKKKIDDFNETCPLLELMANKAMKDRHWKRLEDSMKVKFEIDSPTFTLADVMAAPLLEYKLDVEDICVAAVKEKDIEAKLKQIISDWAVVFLSFTSFKTRGELLVKAADVGDIIGLLEDSMMIMNSLLSNRYNAPFKKDIQLWAWKLSTTSEILEKWLMIQNLWMYLEAVFVGGDISKQLPQEAKRFATIDKTWVKLMARARERPNVIDCCVGDATMGQTLPFLMEQLEACQKSLTGYLEAKRLCFPRFFFISDPVLLEILGQSSNPAAVQPHLLSLFDAVASIEFDERRNDKIVTLLSVFSEKVPLEKPVICAGGVEVWINSLLFSMRETIRTMVGHIAGLLMDPAYDFIANYESMVGQEALLGIQLLWTKKAEEALHRVRIDRLAMRMTNQLFLDLLNALIENTTKTLTKMERTQLETMITIHLHQRDIFDDLVRFKVKTPTDFEWQKQARFYHNEETEECWVRITDVIFIYQDEYLGVTERLCITPLTDRCYITLSQAIWMNMGGAPAGPAGTGKTETTKDMGRALGKFVVVFNCSDQMDFRGLGRIFKGLAQSGTWGCFDEFNRIELPVLSVAAQQIYIVLTARKERKPFFIFSDGDVVSMNIEFGIFLTMNPGYAGRQELPENLKIMFRTVAMMVPDRQIIIRVKLASCGFKENNILARKFFTLYALCEEQLSKQVHYDFGLRNILSVLRTLGAQKRANPSETEETIVFRVLREMNVSKLIDEDEPLFLSLCDDMFPGIKLTALPNKELQRCIANQTSEMGLMNHADFNLKVVQLHDTSLVRHGLMTLGPTGAGKTKVILCLMRCFTEMGRPHKEMRMNPKAITAPQMFGRLDVATNDWTDGIFSTLWRRSLKVKLTEFTWLVLDGPVDAVWIENLNSVLDDNKTLTLANGDRIVMAVNSKIVFEPDNVDNASPATVSRMGMVFISSSVLKWTPLLDGWLLKRSDNEANVLRPFFTKIYDDLHTFVQSRLAAKMAILEAIYIRQCCDVLGGLLDYDPNRRGYPPRVMERFFLFSLMWSLGAVLEVEDRVKIETFILSHSSKMNWPKPKENETIFEFCVGDDGQWCHWNDKVSEYIYPSDSVPDYNSILVPNVDNVRTNFLIDLSAKQWKPVLLIGEQGSAKTVMIKGYLAHYDPEEHLSKSMNFSSATTPNMFQRIIESYVEKRQGTTYGPPSQRKMTIFVDDINMPIVNEWGDQVTNEIVRQMIEAGGFYSLEKPGDFSYIVDILMVAAMIHPGGGRNDIPPRLKRQFCIFNCTLPSNTSMDKIFSVIGQGYFCVQRFNASVVEFIPKIIPLTRRIWQLTKIKMLPTPAKFHYVFNLRDLSRIWQGILTIQSLECPDPEMVMKLWDHECNRVIADRFITEDDITWFNTTMKRTAMEDLGEQAIYYPAEHYWFVDFLREAPEPTGDEPDDFSFEPPKVYEVWPSKEYIAERLYGFMELYNENTKGANMALVLFDDALKHLLKISRIIRTERGNALLVGVGGSGKQSLTRLASYIAGYTTYQITLTRTYNTNNLVDDLKILYRLTGLKGTGVSFIFTDNEIKDEAFLEFINNVLNSGEVANLFPKDELDEILNELINPLKKFDPRLVPTADVLYDFFISRARANLHIVLCFSPVGEKFRNRSLKFPGLISGCTMDWFAKWPMDALVAVSGFMLGPFPMVATPEIKEGIISLMGRVHDAVADTCVLYFERFRRQSYVTPKSFLSFLQGYQTIYIEKHEFIKEMADKMLTGLDKLIEAAASVDVLRKELAVKEVEIAEANKKAEAVLIVVVAATEIATKIKEEATATKEKAEALVRVISADSAVAEAKLEAAKPALAEAEAALQTIKGADIATVRKLGKPPYLVTLIMDVVCILFKRHIEPVKPDPERKFLMSSWNESLKVMGDTRFLFNLQQYPKDTINAEIVDLMQPYLNYPLYTFEAAKTACGNVAGLISWTISMAVFYGINKDVLPMKANLAKQNARLQIALGELDAAMKLLRAKEAEVAECQKEYDGAMAMKKAVLEEAQLCQLKMDAATALIDGLGGERIRWTEQSKLFKAEIERLVGDVLILIGFLSYTGPFNQEFRNMLIRMWMDDLRKSKIPVSSAINIVDSLADTVTIGEWGLQGLPNDELSIQNGIIVTKASRYPLLIDPQTQGKIWISNKEAKNNLCTTSLNHKYFRQHIEDCVSLGYPMLIEDVLEELDPVLDNVMEKNYIKSGNNYKVKVGDKEVDLCAGFKIYITTKLANPSYSPEISARASIIDFTVTMKGLEDQLLGRVILTEKNELEIERTNLITDVTNNKRKMKELEDNLLYKLTSTKGSLVEDVTVIQVLNVTKETAAEVFEKLEIAKETEKKIDAAREEYRPVAARGSVLYFMVVSMAEVNCMYQTSLNQFLERFDYSLEKSEKSLATVKRINYIIEYLTFEIFRYKCRGLYEIHKNMFVLMLSLKIDLHRRNITHEEFEYLIKGGAALDLNACPPKPAKWITDMCWLNLVEISKLRQFQYVLSQVEAGEKNWKNWYEKDAPEETPFPDNYHTLDVFRSLLMVRAWCPDRILAQSRKYIAGSMGQRYADPVILNYENMHLESRAMTPLICFLSMGSDPTPNIEGLAKKKGITCSAISMGQGQEVHARKLISNSLTEGSWVLLQNCHLGLEYMNELLLFLLDVEKSGNFHPEFRVWLTSEPHLLFPITLLQICIKYTNEPPSGIRAGLKRTYSSMNQDWLEYSTSPFYLPMIFAVSYMHTIVQERRKFGPLGWNIPYEFNSSDWLCCCMFVQNHLDDLDPTRGISWNTVRYMFGEVQYGGRVTDDYDKRLLNTFCKCWFGDFMFSESFNFYTGYVIMKFKTIAEYLDAIENMSGVDPPQAYGLHPNADITYQSNTAGTMLDVILSIQPKQSSGGGGETREQAVYRMAVDMLEKTPPNYDPFAVRDRLRIMGILSPMNIFLRQEIDRIQRVIRLVRGTLKDLLLGIEGTIIMNENLRKAFDFIYDAKIPPHWLRYSWISSTLGFWFTEFLERNGQFSNWCFNGRPTTFWMTGFFNPQGFLTAMRQEVARAHKGWALDVVVLHNDVLKLLREDVKVPPAEGVYVYGLYLDGAGWNRRDSKLCESTNKILFTAMPVVHVYAINSIAPKDPKLYTCPVYKKPNRTGLTYITALWLPSAKPPEHWIMRGVAMLCDIK